MGLLKAFGAAAESLGQGLSQAGALKYQTEQKQDQRDWEWKKMVWADEKATKSAASKAHRESYKILAEQIEKEEGHLLDALGGAPNVLHKGYDEEQLNARLAKISALKDKVWGMFMGVSGASGEELTHLFKAYQKIIDTGPDDVPKLTKEEEKSVTAAEARLSASAAGDAVYGGMDDDDAMWQEENPYAPGTIGHTFHDPEVTEQIESTGYDFPGAEAKEKRDKEVEGRRSFIDNAWKVLLAGPEERTFRFFKAYTSDEEWNNIKSTIGDPGMSDEQAGEILWDRLKDMGATAGKDAADRIVDVIKLLSEEVKKGFSVKGAATPHSERLRDPIRVLLSRLGLITETDDIATEEEASSLEAINQGDPDALRAAGITPVGDEATSGFPDVSGDETTGIIDGQRDQGLLARVDADQQAGYGRKFASTELPPGAMDSTVSMDDTALPPGEMTTTPRGETIETPPAPVEPHDVNYVEGRKAGTTNITSMTVGDIAEQYGYNTRVGMMALTYNEIIELMGKHFYKNMSEKEVRERVDSLPFGDNIQKQLLLLSLGED